MRGGLPKPRERADPGRGLLRRDSITNPVCGRIAPGTEPAPTWPTRSSARAGRVLLSAPVGFRAFAARAAELNVRADGAVRRERRLVVLVGAVEPPAPSPLGWMASRTPDTTNAST